MVAFPIGSAADNRPSRTMKIFFLVSSLHNGGAERVAVTLCNAWTKRGDDVTLVPTFSGRGEAFYEISTGVKLIYLADVVGIRKKNIWTYALRFHALRRLIVERCPDVIISFLPNVNVAAIISSAFLQIPVIICERTDPSRCLPSGLWPYVCKLFYRYADMLTVQTESVAVTATKIFPRLKRVRSIPNPVPEAVTTIEAALRGNRKILLSLSRLSSEKQIDKLISAFSQVASRFGEWDLHIYGDGPERAALEEKIEAVGVRTRAFLKGASSTPWTVMACADIFVLTSKYEGFPNALLEAMGAGLPCIAFDCPSGPREITRNGKDALLISMNDHEGLVAALAKLMEDQEFRSSLGRQARESVCARFNLTKILRAWDELFEEVGAIKKKYLSATN